MNTVLIYEETMGTETWGELGEYTESGYGPLFMWRMVICGQSGP